MNGRRQFLGAATLGLIASLQGSGGLFAQDPKPKAKSKAKAKGKASPQSKSEGSPLVASEQINRILGQARTDGRRLPGMIGAVIRGEEIEAIGSVGLRRIGSTEPIRIDDVVHLGSCSKAMTATMIGTLIDEGKLRWDSTVQEVFPDQASRAHPDYLSVTIRQLLSHTAGFTRDISWWNSGQERSVVEQRRNLMAKALQVPPEHKPGTTYSYSNVGFVLAGMMAEEVTRTPWEELMSRRVFEPLKMTSAGFGPPGMRSKVDHAWGHRASGNVVEAVYEDNPPALGPAGTIHATVPDWARFASLHLKGSIGGVSLVKPETMKALHTPRQGEEYAGGWQVVERPWGGSGHIFTHTGSNTFWFCTIWLAPAKNFGLLAVTNAGGKPAEDACDQAIQGLLQYAVLDGPNRRG